jgi:hypothetical protein
VVAGVTTPLPDGGRLADGIYAPNFDRLYLTNIDRNRLEVFDVGRRAVLAAWRWARGPGASPRGRRGATAGSATRSSWPTRAART